MAQKRREWQQKSVARGCLVVGGWWLHMEECMFEVARFVEADEALGVGFDLVF
jgi:hypothetical protein